MNPIRKHLSYANVVATLALVFAMSGGALAAQHYLVNSTKQINPKVLKKLRGRPGARGGFGATGPQVRPGLLDPVVLRVLRDHRRDPPAATSQAAIQTRRSRRAP